MLTAGLTVHYMVRSKDSAGNESKSLDQTTILKGHSVKVRVRDSANKPVPGVKVNLYSTPMEALTDSQGTTTFSDVSLGKHLIIARKELAQVSKEIVVTEQPQEVMLQFVAASPSASNSMIYVGIAMLVLITLAIYLVLWTVNHKRSKSNA